MMPYVATETTPTCLLQDIEYYDNLNAAEELAGQMTMVRDILFCDLKY